MDVIDRIYEAALVPECWRGALSAVETVSESDEGSMLLFRDDGPPDIVGSGLLEGELARFQALWRASPAVRWGLTNQPADFQRFTDNIPQAVLDADPAIRMLTDRGLGDQLVSVHPLGEGAQLGFTFLRRAELGGFAAAAVARLNALRPHLVRSGLMAMRLGTERARTMVDALDRLGIAAAVITSGGRVIAANALLEAQPTVLVATAFGGIALADRLRDERFRTALARAGAGADGPAQSIPLPGDNAHAPQIVHLVPVRGQARDVFAGGHVLIAVTPIGGKGRPRPELLHGLFDLTPAEARLTHELLAGGSLGVIAARIGVSHHTVRAQLRSVMAKTGTHRQAELTQLLARL